MQSYPPLLVWWDCLLPLSQSVALGMQSYLIQSCRSGGTVYSPCHGQLRWLSHSPTSYSLVGLVGLADRAHRQIEQGTFNDLGHGLQDSVTDRTQGGAVNVAL